LQAAIALQDRARLMDLPLGVGIAVGSALVGQLTGGDNIDVIGEATNLAARLQAQAVAGEIVLSDDANRRVRAWLESNGVDARSKMLELKGYPAPVEAFVIAST
jgi:class 3 adenylate cyclase